jgi:hypothetical protein
MQIQVEETLEERTSFFWKIKGRWFGRYVIAPFLIVWLMLWAVAWLGGLVDLFERGLINDERQFLLIWFVVWTIGGIFFVYVVIQLLRPARAEYLELGRYDLIFQPDFAPGAFWLWGWGECWTRAFGSYRWWKELNPKKKIQAEKHKIGRVRLQWDGWDWRLFMYIGGKRFEIARTLKEPERRWLAEVLRAWSKS